MEAIIGVHVRPPPSQRDFGCRKCLLHSVAVPSAPHRFLPSTCASQFAAGFIPRLACIVGLDLLRLLDQATHGLDMTAAPKGPGCTFWI